MTEYKKPVGRTVCADGTSLSVQASAFHYCIPRDNEGPYIRMEVGFIEDKNGAPLTPPDAWAEYADGEFPNAVYGYVPVALIDAFIVEHGGAATLTADFAKATSTAQ